MCLEEAGERTIVDGKPSSPLSRLSKAEKVTVGESGSLGESGAEIPSGTGDEG